MKTKKTKNRLVVTLNKHTIADLNHFQMHRIGGGGFQEDQDQQEGEAPILGGETVSPCEQPTPVPTDGGIPPLLSNLFNCY